MHDFAHHHPAAVLLFQAAWRISDTQLQSAPDNAPVIIASLGRHDGKYRTHFSSADVQITMSPENTDQGLDNIWGV